MLIAGLDPSFTRTGISIYDTERSFLFLDAVSKLESTEKTYQAMFNRVLLFGDRVVEALYSKGDLDTLISEEPLPTALFSSGLYTLDTHIFYRLIHDKGINTIYNLHPTYCKYVKEAKKSIKSESVILAKEIIDTLKLNKVTVIQYTNRLNNDTAESFIFLFRLMVRNGIILPSGKNCKDLPMRRRFHEEKEKLLYTRSK